jgi:tRNA(adenine34) deaminase
MASGKTIIGFVIVFLSLLVCRSHGWMLQWSFGRQGRRMLPANIETQTAAEQHTAFMGMALEQARKAGSRGEVPIGAVIVERTQDGKCHVLSQACNMVETQHDASAHAELLALRQAGRRANNWRLPNATLYTTLEPCPMCLTAAQAFRVNSIVYGAPDLRLGAVETHLRLLDVTHPFHTIGEVVPGISADESANLLKDFFRKRRKESKMKSMEGPGIIGRMKRILRGLRSLLSR